MHYYLIDIDKVSVILVLESEPAAHYHNFLIKFFSLSKPLYAPFRLNCTLYKRRRHAQTCLTHRMINKF